MRTIRWKVATILDFSLLRFLPVFKKRLDDLN